MIDELVALAQQGDRKAFDTLVAPHLPRLRALLRRMVGDPQDTADLLQDTLLRAHTRLGTFRGESALGTWLYAIASRVAIDHLSSRRLGADAKLQLREYVHAEEAGELRQHLSPAGSRFDAREHIAFCFTCVARSLPAEEQAALVLRDVLELSNDEAARALDLSTSVLRHRLASARETMQQRYEGLCRLVAKTGVCHQCEGLRDGFAEGHRGPPVPVLSDDEPDRAYRRRLAVVREADVDAGTAQPFHDFLWRALASLEARRQGAGR